MNTTIKMSKQALISLLSDRNQRIEELQTQSNYFEGEFCTQKRITTELQAQVAVSEDDLRVAEAGIAELQAQVEKLERLCKTEFEELSDDDYSEWENVAGRAKVAELQEQVENLDRVSSEEMHKALIAELKSEQLQAQVKKAYVQGWTDGNNNKGWTPKELDERIAAIKGEKV